MSAATGNVRSNPPDRRNLWLAIVAVVQVAVLVFVLLTVARPPRTQTGPLLGKGVQTSDITAFTVTGSDGTSIAVKRDGSSWVLPDQGGFPAQTSRVTSFLQELVGLQRSGLVATTKDAYKRLKVSADTFQRKVALTLKGGKNETLLIGSEPSYGSTHVRLASDKGVYVSHSIHASDARTDAAGYIDTTLLKLDEANVTRMEVKNQSGDFVFTKGAAGWTMQGVPSGKTFDPTSVNGLLSSLTRLQIDEPLGKTAKPAYGFDKPLAVVTLTTVSKPASSGKGSATGTSSGSSGSGPSSSGSGASGSSSSGSSGSGSGSPSSSASGAAKGNASAPAGSGSGTASGSSTAATSNTATSNATTSSTAAAGSTAASKAAAGTSAAAGSAAKPVTQTTTITVGSKAKNGFYHVRVSSSPFIVTASDSNLGSVVGKKEADFFVKPKTTAKGSSGAAGSGLRSLSGLGGATTGQ